MFKLLYILLFVVFFIFSCSEKKETSQSLECTDALNNENYDLAISTCTKKEKGDAYFGKAGFTFNKLLDNLSEIPIPVHIDNSSQDLLGSLDKNASKVLKTLGFAYSDDNNSNSRKNKIGNSLIYIQEAKKYFGAEMNCENSYCQDAALKYAIANSFAIELWRVDFFDKEDRGCDDDNCTLVTNTDDNCSSLENYDGYIFSVDINAVKYKYTTVNSYCSAISPLADYTMNIQEGIERSGVMTDETKFILDNSTSTVCSIFKNSYEKCNEDGNDQLYCENECSKVKTSCRDSWN